VLDRRNEGNGKTLRGWSLFNAYMHRLANLAS
jgi:hypothetical protein